MRYLSVCSGIEAATVAWHGLGWTPVAFSEIDPFPCDLLAHHYPDVPNWGDMTKFKEWPDADVDVLVGGTPCQSFSVSGLRAGLADPRGNLMLTYLAIAGRYRPEWVVWENVPGVLSSNGGLDFAALLRGLAELGYGFAYRILDAQYVRVESHPRAVPQRRRRVFVVGCLGSWQRAAAVLFERESMSGHPPPRRQAGQGFTYSVAPCIGASGRGFERAGDTRGNDALIPSLCMSSGQANAEHGTEVGTTLTTLTTLHEAPIVAFAQNQRDEVRTMDVAGALAGEPGMKQQTFVAFTNEGNHGRMDDRALARAEDLPAGAVREMRGVESGGASQGRQLAQPRAGELGTTLSQLPHQGASAPRDLHDLREPGEGTGVLQPALSPVQAVGRPVAGGGEPERTAMQVRRLTPKECERLQGFPDDYTLIPRKGKLAADGPRYKALGNSMAVNCMRWIGERIAMVDEIE